MSAGRVIVIGSTNTDLVVHCPRLPSPGESIIGGDLQTFAGGKGANQAVAAARCGARALFIGAFGDDAFGAARLADLRRQGVDCTGCVIKKGAPSGVALIGISDAAGRAKAENLIVVAPGANLKLSAADARRGLPRDLSDADVVLGCLEVPFPAIEEAFARARKAGALTILNPAPFPHGGIPARLLQLSDVLTPNESEAAALFGGDIAGNTDEKSPASAKLLRVLRGGTRHLIVTRGARGATYFYAYNDPLHTLYSPDRPEAKGDEPALLREMGRSVAELAARSAFKIGQVSMSAPKVKAVDTVGAGDCFNGSLAASLARQPFAFDEAIPFAIAAASLKVTRAGAQAGLPRRAEVLRQMRESKREK